jgi:hypothetical protein
MNRRVPRRRRRPYGVWALRAAGLLIVLAVGIAFGQALDDSSPQPGTNTSIRTLVPARETVTVTVPTP